MVSKLSREMYAPTLTWNIESWDQGWFAYERHFLLLKVTLSVCVCAKCSTLVNLKWIDTLMLCVSCLCFTLVRGASVLSTEWWGWHICSLNLPLAIETDALFSSFSLSSVCYEVKVSTWKILYLLFIVSLALSLPLLWNGEMWNMQTQFTFSMCISSLAWYFYPLSNGWQDYFLLLSARHLWHGCVRLSCKFTSLFLFTE